MNSHFLSLSGLIRIWWKTATVYNMAAADPFVHLLARTHSDNIDLAHNLCMRENAGWKWRVPSNLGHFYYTRSSWNVLDWLNTEHTRLNEYVWVQTSSSSPSVKRVQTSQITRYSNALKSTNPFHPGIYGTFGQFGPCTGSSNDWKWLVYCNSQFLKKRG